MLFCRELLKYVNQRYGHPDIIVTENGVDVPGEASLAFPDVLRDSFRINYMQTYLDQVGTCTFSQAPALQQVYSGGRGVCRGRGGGGGRGWGGWWGNRGGAVESLCLWENYRALID